MLNSTLIMLAFFLTQLLSLKLSCYSSFTLIIWFLFLKKYFCLPFFLIYPFVWLALIVSFANTLSLSSAVPVSRSPIAQIRIASSCFFTACQKTWHNIKHFEVGEKNLQICNSKAFSKLMCAKNIVNTTFVCCITLAGLWDPSACRGWKRQQ